MITKWEIVIAISNPTDENNYKHIVSQTVCCLYQQVQCRCRLYFSACGKTHKSELLLFYPKHSETLSKVYYENIILQ